MRQKQYSDSNWHKAMTLRERIDTLDFISIDSSYNNSISTQLSDWKLQPPFNLKDYFSQRLALIGITEDTLSSLINESDDKLKQRFDISADWLKKLKKAFNEYAFTNKQNQSLFENQKMGRLLIIVEPLIKQALDIYEVKILNSIKKFKEVPVDLKNIRAILIQAYVNPIFSLIFRTVILEFNVARLKGILQGETPEDRFGSFF